MRTRRPLILLPIAALLGASALPFPTATAVESTLPGGTPIAVEIATPANGAVLPPGPVTITGSARIGAVEPVVDLALAYVLDVSESTLSPSGGNCRDDQNGDGVANSVMDCEIAAAKLLNEEADRINTVGDVGAVAFSGVATTADVGPATGKQLVTGPATDDDGVGGRDLEQVLASAKPGANGHIDVFPPVQFLQNLTNFEDAVAKTTTVVQALRQRNKIVVFLSDGFATEGGDITDNVNILHGTGAKVFAFALGSGSLCSNPGRNNQGTLNEIAGNGGICRQLPDVTTLPDVLPDLIRSQLTSLTLSVDGGPSVPITDVSKPLPLLGPDNLSYRVTTGSLTSGTHRLCVTANGADSQGTGHVTDCRSVTINASPRVDAGGPYSGLEDNQVPIVGSVVDPDSPGLVTTWAIRAGEGVPPGSRCTFGDAGRLSTTVSCTERGVYELTLTADDRVNPPVVGRATLTLTNVPPSVSAGGPYQGNEDNQVPIAGKVDDPDGPRLTTTWSIRPTDAVAPGATCTFADPKALSTTVSCTDHGGYVLTLTADDGVNPPVANSTTLTLINVRPEVSAGGPYSGEEDHQVPIAGTVVDPDSPGLTTTWSIIPIPGATCTFGDPSQLSTVVSCSEPGTYVLTLTVNDNVNPPVVVRTTVTLKQTPAALSLIASVDPAPGFVGGDPVTVTYTVRNGGPGEMRSVRLTPTLPANPRPEGVSPASCANACELGTLLAGQSVQVRFTFSSNASADFTVSGTVTTTGLDLDAADNTAGARVLIRQPSLTVDPGMGTQGFVTRATGRDFPAGARIQLRWSVGLSETPGEVTVRPDGTFDAQVLIFPKDTKGFRTLLAQPASGPRFARVSSNPFLVVARTLKPSMFVIR